MGNGLSSEGIHNFSRGVLESYFEISKKKVRIEKGILRIETSKPKTFVFSFHEDQVPLLERYQKQGVIYSIPELPLKKQSLFSEIVYSLEEVLSHTSYENAKKRHKYLVYPFSWCRKENISFEPITKENIRLVIDLHDEWVKHKIEDPKTYKIMFPSGRYKRCCLNALNNLSSNMSLMSLFEKKQEWDHDLVYASYVAIKDGKAIGCRVLSIEDRIAYDLAFFCNTWEEGISQFANYMQIITLKDLYNKGILTVNCGSSLNPHLKNFKQHLPCFTLNHYMYSKEN